MQNCNDILNTTESTLVRQNKKTSITADIIELNLHNFKILNAIRVNYATRDDAD